MQEDAGECTTFCYAFRKFRKDYENFATIPKISQSLQNFSMHSFSLSYGKFAIIAKVTMHSENLNFLYALYFRHDSEIYYA